ncbi:MAG: hypothetical protein E6H07_10315 [Bacteroidetes bacterium]|nr:MAG: hypothetical protein E6H07_10315 [Bacteroidota bacterium]
MPFSSQIQYLTNKQIDKTKWDKCIAEASNGLIYAYSFYLDTMAKHWDALIFNDYEAVMPLTWNKKYGIHYLYQPAFTAQLGLFGEKLDYPLLNSFINAIPGKFKLAEICLNSGNVLEHRDEFILRTNHVLSLNRSYEDLVAGYRENHQRNIKKTFQLGYTVKKDIAVEEITLINKELLNAGKLPEEDYYHFEKLFHLLKQKQQAETYAIVNEQKAIMASCVFFYSHNRAYYILVGNTPDGKTIGASHALIDAFIKDNAEKNLVLDFEGSDIRNLAFFYGGFGAKEELYPFFKINKLPFYLKWMKK